METGDIVQTIIQGKIIEATDLEEISEGMVDRIVEKITGRRDMVVIVETGIGQGRELLQGVMSMEEAEALAMEETEALAMIGPDMDLELVQIGIG